MAQVLITSARFSSMLTNRGMKLAHFTKGITTGIDLSSLQKVDQLVEFEDLLVIAKRFKHAWPYLLIDEAETSPKRGYDNRTVLNQRRALTAEIVDQLEAAEAMLQAAAELFSEIVFELPVTKITSDSPSADAAAAIRALLGVSHEEQLATKDDYAALRLWSSALQERGVYVSQRRLNDPTVRAFSIVEGNQAVVVADTQDIPHARIFSLLHEYVHIVLRSTGICDLNEHTALERYCNEVAAATLMPSGLLRAQLPAGHSFGVSVEADERVVADVSRRLGVSRAALLIRLRDENVLDQSDLDVLEKRRQERRGKDKAAAANYYDPAINKVGMRFARNVFGALDAGHIDRQDAGTLLEVGEHLVDNYRKRLIKRTGSLP